MGGRRWSPRKVLSPGASCQPAHPSIGALFHVREVGKSKLLLWAFLNMKPLLCCHLGLWASHHCLVANISPCLKVCCCFKWHLQTGKWHLHLLSLSWVWGVSALSALLRGVYNRWCCSGQSCQHLCTQRAFFPEQFQGSVGVLLSARCNIVEINYRKEEYCS